MAKLNTARKPIHTHEGAKAKHINPLQQLRRSVMACLLWENQFYESGQTIAERIKSLSAEVPADVLAALAVEARKDHNLRHAPLLLCACLAKYHRGAIVGKTIEQVISRADELAELVAVVCEVNETPPSQVKKVLSAQTKKGLAHAFQKFDGYALGKYNRPGEIRLRDVLFMCHAKPKDSAQEQLWKQLVDGTLSAPDTWEVGLSSGADKGETFTRLLREGKLGYLALLRNLRNMLEAGVDTGLIREALLARKGADKVLPFRFIAAARHAPQLEPVLDQALVANINNYPALPGKTLVLVDVSMSMDSRLSAKSDLTRMDAAAALASVIPGDVRVFSFSAGNLVYWGDRWNGQPVAVECPPRKGMAGVDSIIRSQNRGGTMMGQAVKEMNEIAADRLIVITDEQSRDPVPDPIHDRAYMINVASNRNGVGYGKWTHIDGFSESVIKFIHAYETELQ